MPPASNGSRMPSQESRGDRHLGDLSISRHIRTAVSGSFFALVDSRGAVSRHSGIASSKRDGVGGALATDSSRHTHVIRTVVSIFAIEWWPANTGCIHARIRCAADFPIFASTTVGCCNGDTSQSGIAEVVGAGVGIVLAEEDRSFALAVGATVIFGAGVLIVARKP